MTIAARSNLTTIRQIDERAALRLPAHRRDKERLHREGVGLADVLDQFDTLKRLARGLGAGDDPQKVQIAAVFPIMTPTIALPLTDIARRAIGAEDRINVEGQRVHVVFQF